MYAHSVRSLGAIFTALALTAALILPCAAEESAGSAPIAQNLTLTTYRNLSVSGQLSALDTDGDLYYYQITGQPTRGSVTLSDSATGEFLYTPYARKTGSDCFTYVAIDREGNVSAPATVSITIEKAKSAVSYGDLEGSGLEALAQRLADSGVYAGMEINGVSYFQPEATVTRAEFLSMAMTACGCDLLEGVTVTGFADDAEIPTWAKSCVATALQKGYITGYTTEDGVVFAPNQAVTAAEAAVILNRILSITNMSQAVFAVNTEAVPAWAVQAVVNLTSCGIPCSTAQNSLTRAEAAEMLCGAMDTLEARQV
ncbi:MAG: S-layer homology domain-containing protein [Oscillospiraceae bacterium]|nr:S-layer homology domain-containing protein [Oscillospiraceae bacterium]